MAVSLPSFCSAVKLKPCLKLSTVNQGAVEARAQRFRDEGRYSNSSKNMVDGNMKVLTERLEVVKMKEKLERCCRWQLGWNYAPNYDYKLKRDRVFTGMVEVVGVIGGTFVFTFFTGTVCLCLVSLFLHFNKIY